MSEPDSDNQPSSDDSDRPTREGLRRDVKLAVTCVVIAGVLGGIALALLFAKLTGMF